MGAPGGVGYVNLPLHGRISASNGDSYSAACVGGLWLIQAPAAGLQQLIDAGALPEMMPHCRAEPLPVTLALRQSPQPAATAAGVHELDRPPAAAAA